MKRVSAREEDLCEQPVLTWVELRALAGLALGAAILVASGHVEVVRSTMQAAVLGFMQGTTEETEQVYSPPALTHPNIDEIPTATVVD